MARRPPGAADAPQGRPEPEAVVPLTADDDAERLAAGLQTTVGDALNRLCDLARDIQGDAPQKLVRRLESLVGEAAAARDAVGEAIARLARGGAASTDGHDGRGARPVRLLVIDEQPIVRKGVAAAVRADPLIVLAAEAGGVGAALAAAARARPDVVLFDYRMADMRAPEAVPLLREALPGVRLVLFTAERSEAALGASIRAGIDGCVLKDAAPADLLEAVRRVAAGETVMDPRLPQVDPAAARPRLSTPLTRRQHEVLRRVAMGETNEEIARAMGLSRNTIKTYLQASLHKLGAHNRVEALAKAAEAGLL